MKKLMIAATIAVAAVVSHAATVTWNSGAVFGPGENGTINFTAPATRIMNSSAVNWYVFSGLTEDQMASAEANAFGWLTETPSGVTKTAANPQGTNQNGLLTAIKTEQANDTTVNYAILITYKDEAGKDWFLVNTAIETSDELGTAISVQNMARYKGGVAGAANQFSAWQTQSVPEPTSGLLLVLGIAGLALKRKRA